MAEVVDNPTDTEIDAVVQFQNPLSFELKPEDVSEQYEDAMERKKLVKSEAADAEQEADKQAQAYQEILKTTVFSDFEKKDFTPSNNDLLDFACSGMVDLNDLGIAWDVNTIDAFQLELAHDGDVPSLNSATLLEVWGALMTQWESEQKEYLAVAASIENNNAQSITTEKAGDEKPENAAAAPAVVPAASPATPEKKEAPTGFMKSVGNAVDKVVGSMLNNLIKTVGTEKGDSLGNSFQLMVVSLLIDWGNAAPQWAQEVINRGDALELRNLKALGIQINSADGKVSKVEMVEAGPAIPMKTIGLLEKLFTRAGAVSLFDKMGRGTTLKDFREKIIPTLSEADQAMALALSTSLKEKGAQDTDSVVDWLEAKQQRIVAVETAMKATDIGGKAIADFEQNQKLAGSPEEMKPVLKESLDAIAKFKADTSQPKKTEALSTAYGRLDGEMRKDPKGLKRWEGTVAATARNEMVTLLKEQGIDWKNTVLNGLLAQKTPKDKTPATTNLNTFLLGSGLAKEAVVSLESDYADFKPAYNGLAYLYGVNATISPEDAKTFASTWEGFANARNLTGSAHFLIVMPSQVAEDYLASRVDSNARKPILTEGGDAVKEMETHRTQFAEFLKGQTLQGFGDQHRGQFKETEYLPVQTAVVAAAAPSATPPTPQ